MLNFLQYTKKYLNLRSIAIFIGLVVVLVTRWQIPFETIHEHNFTNHVMAVFSTETLHIAEPLTDNAACAIHCFSEATSNIPTASLISITLLFACLLTLFLQNKKILSLHLVTPIRAGPYYDPKVLLYTQKKE